MDEMKSTQGVMIHVQDDVKRFIGKDIDSPIIKMYQKAFNDIAWNVEKMARLEELTLQQRCIGTDDNLKIKLSFLREYVYARCPFYRRDKSTKDIRVIVSRVDIIDPTNPSPSIDDLEKNEAFMQKAKVKLISAMRDEFVKTSANYWNEYD